MVHSVAFQRRKSLGFGASLAQASSIPRFVNHKLFEFSPAAVLCSAYIIITFEWRNFNFKAKSGGVTFACQTTSARKARPGTIQTAAVKPSDSFLSISLLSTPWVKDSACWLEQSRYQRDSTIARPIPISSGIPSPSGHCSNELLNLCYSSSLSSDFIWIRTMVLQCHPRHLGGDLSRLSFAFSGLRNLGIGPCNLNLSLACYSIRSTCPCSSKPFLPWIYCCRSKAALAPPRSPLTWASRWRCFVSIPGSSLASCASCSF